MLLSSSAAPTADRGNAVARYHIASEAAVRESGLRWTFLQPNSFMTNTLQWADAVRRSEPVRAPFSDVPVATIDPADVGAVAAAALMRGDVDGHSLRLSGPAALTPDDRGRILSEVLGRDIEVVAQPDDEARAEMLRTIPEPYVRAFFEFFREGTVDETTVQPTVEQVLGRTAATFREWAARNAAAFGGS